MRSIGRGVEDIGEDGVKSPKDPKVPKSEETNEDL